MCSCCFPSISGLLAPACSFFLLSWKCKSPAQHYQQVSQNVSPWTRSDRENAMGHAPTDVKAKLLSLLPLPKTPAPSLETGSNAAMFGSFLELPVIFSQGDPIWQDFPAVVCCLEPAVRLFHNKFLQTRSFPAEKKKGIIIFFKFWSKTLIYYYYFFGNDSIYLQNHSWTESP